MVVFGKDQVNAGSLEIAVEKQLRVRNDNRARRNVRSLRSDALDMGMRMGMRPRIVNRQFGVEFADEIQCATAKG